MFGTCYLVCHIKHCDEVELSTLESPFKKKKVLLSHFLEIGVSWFLATVFYYNKLITVI